LWKNKYKIGVDKIDEQHEELFHRVSEFIFLLRNGGQWEDKVQKVKETLEFMQSYVVVHFDDEETYQNEINYPELIIHKEIHDKFKHDICIFEDRFNDEGYNEVLVQKYASILLAWLIKHVVVSDGKIGNFVRAQKLES